MSVPVVRVVLVFFLFAAANLGWWWLSNRPQEAGADIPGGQVRSVSFASFREGQSPLDKIYPSPAEIEADIALLAGKVRGLRTYTSLEGMDLVPPLARKYGLKVTHSAWLGREDVPPGEVPAPNGKEVDALIATANAYPDVVERVIVGNEVLLRRDLTPEQLIAYIRKVKRSVRQPVSYADVWAFFLKHPQVADEVDFLTIHILPYWEDEPVDVDAVGEHIVAIYRKMQAVFPGKPILIGEAGWPSMGRSRGPADPGRVNAAKFLRSLVSVADANGFDYNVVEAFDQPWKAELEGTVGAKWGLWSVDREAKIPMAGPVVEHPDWPWRFALSVAIAAALLLPVAGWLRGGRGAMVTGLAHLLGMTLAQYVFAARADAVTFWAKAGSGPLPGLAAAGFCVLAAIFAMAAVEQAARQMAPKAPPTAVARLGEPLSLFFAALGLLLTVALVVDGRYRDIPVLPFLAPVAATIGLALVRLASGRRAIHAFSQAGLFGGAAAGRLPRWLPATMAVALALAAVANIVAEGLAIVGEDFSATHPGFDEQWPLVVRAMFANSAVLLWSAMLVLMALPHAADALLLRQGGRRAAATLH